MSGRDEIKAVYRAQGFVLPGWLKYDPGQKRDGEGRWTTTGGGGRGGQSSAEINSIEDGIVGQDFESGVCFNSDGNKIWRGDGNNRSVTIPGGALVQMRGGALTHNHPGGESFSREDIQTATEHKFAQIRAVGTHNDTRYRYTWKPNGQMQMPVYDRARTRVIEKNKVSHAAGTLNHEEASFNFDHEIWMETTKIMRNDYGVETGYKREVF